MKKGQKMNDHPVSNIFPLMPESQILLLSKDISANGQREPIILLDGMILDGRNRYRACRHIGVEPKIKTYDGLNPLNDIISWNLHRRHLNESQRAMIAAKLANMPAHRPTTSVPRGTLMSQTDTAKSLNVSRHSVIRARQILDTEDMKLIKEVEAGKKKVSVAVREQKRREDEEAIKNKTFPVIEGKFKTILVDPPWDYDLNLDGRAKPEYTVMSMDQLKELEIDKYAESNAHLYVWSTNNNIPLALELGLYWGFSYKTLISWIKPSIGMGSYFRNSTEQLLFFTKGQLSTRAKDIPTHFEAARSKHSEKPEHSYQIIERASYPAYLEIFGRKERANWMTWGNIDV